MAVESAPATRRGGLVKGFRLPAFSVLAPVLVVAASLASASPPDRPVVIEPTGTLEVNPYDVHIETMPFHDPDPGDSHASTDWEIWDLAARVRVWADLDSTILTHDHL